MLNALLAIITLRTFFVFFSTAISIALVMLFLNIITIDEIVEIFNLSPGAAQILKNVLSRIQEVTGNILNIISQLLKKLFSWAGVDIDLSSIKAADIPKPEIPKSGIPTGVPTDIPAAIPAEVMDAL